MSNPRTAKWTLGLAAAALILAIAVLYPRTTSTPPSLPNDVELLEIASELDLYENFATVEILEALDDLDAIGRMVEGSTATATAAEPGRPDAGFQHSSAEQKLTALRLEAYKSLAPDDQAQLRQAVARFEGAEPAEQQAMRLAHQRYGTSRPRVRARIRRNYQVFQNFTPEQRQKAVEAVRAIRAKSKADQRKLYEGIERWRSMPEGKREKLRSP